MYALVLALILAQPAGDFQQAKSHTGNRDYEASLQILKRLPPAVDNEYAYLMAVNYFALNNKAEAEKWIGFANDSFTPLPRRYASLLWMMEQEVKTWKQNDLGDIERDMRRSADRLDTYHSGEKTQKVQADIVSKLDKLIKEQEDQANAKNKKGQDDQQANGKQIPGQGNPNQPAPDSHVMGGSGQGKVDEKKLREVAQNWGTLPPAERAKITQEITRDLPVKYRPMIEEYFKALNRTHNK